MTFYSRFRFPTLISPYETLPSVRGYRVETTHLHGGGTSFDRAVFLVVVDWWDVIDF